MKHLKKSIVGLLVLTLLLGVFGGVPVSAASKKITLKSGKAAPSTIYVGQSYSLKVAGVKVKFTSSNKKVATIGSANGKLKVVGAGTVKITAKNTKTGKSVATKTFTVKQRAKTVNIVVRSDRDVLGKNPSDVKLFKGDTLTIEAYLSPKTSTDVVRYTSDDRTVAKVGTTSGKITAVDLGRTKINVIAKATKSTSNANKENKTRTLTVYVVDRLPIVLPTLEDAFYAVKDANVAALDATATVKDSINDVYRIPDEDTGLTVERLYSDDSTYQWYMMIGKEPKPNSDIKLDGETDPTYTPSVKNAGVFRYYCEVTTKLNPNMDKNDWRWEEYGDTVLYTNVAVIEVGGKATVNFDANGGYFWGLQPAPVYEIEKGKAVGSLPYNLSRDGKDFVGWATNPDAPASDVTSSMAITKDTTLYAVWKDEEYHYTPPVIPLAEEPMVFGEETDRIFYSNEDTTPRLYVEYENPTDGGTLSFQWYKNGNAIAGATEAHYIIPETDWHYGDLVQDRYFCRVTNTKEGCRPNTVDSEDQYVTFIDTMMPLIVFYHAGSVDTSVATGSAISHGCTVYSTNDKVVAYERTLTYNSGGACEHANNLFDVSSNTYEWTPYIDDEDDADRFNGFSTFYIEDVFEYLSIETYLDTLNRAVYWTTENEDWVTYISEHLSNSHYCLDLYLVEIDYD